MAFPHTEKGQTSNVPADYWELSILHPNYFFYWFHHYAIWFLNKHQVQVPYIMIFLTNRKYNLEGNTDGKP